MYFTVFIVLRHMRRPPDTQWSLLRHLSVIVSFRHTINRLSVDQSVRPFVRLSICFSICLHFLCFWISLLSVHQSVYHIFSVVRLSINLFGSHFVVCQSVSGPDDSLSVIFLLSRVASASDTNGTHRGLLFVCLSANFTSVCLSVRPSATFNLTRNICSIYGAVFTSGTCGSMRLMPWSRYDINFNLIVTLGRKGRRKMSLPST